MFDKEKNKYLEQNLDEQYSGTPLMRPSLLRPPLSYDRKVNDRCISLYNVHLYYDSLPNPTYDRPNSVYYDFSTKYSPFNEWKYDRISFHRRCLSRLLWPLNDPSHCSSRLHTVSTCISSRFSFTPPFLCRQTPFYLCCLPPPDWSPLSLSVSRSQRRGVTVNICSSSPSLPSIDSRQVGEWIEWGQKKFKIS